MFTLFYSKISIFLIILLILIKFLKCDLIKYFQIIDYMVKANRLIFFISIKPITFFRRKYFKKCILFEYDLLFFIIRKWKHFHDRQINKVRVPGLNSSFKCILKLFFHFIFCFRISGHPQIKWNFFWFWFFFFQDQLRKRFSLKLNRFKCNVYKLNIFLIF